jgi:hypothetical protein
MKRVLKTDPYDRYSDSASRTNEGLWFDFRQGQGIFLFSTVFRSALMLAQLSTIWAGGSFPECKAAGE